MKAPQRDNLLIRLDERSLNTWRIIEEIKDHLVRLNRDMGEQNRQVASNKTSIGRLWWLIGIITTGSGGTVGITKLLGLW